MKLLNEILGTKYPIIQGGKRSTKDTSRFCRTLSSE